jgi:hypothetical protein
MDRKGSLLIQIKFDHGGGNQPRSNNHKIKTITTIIPR